MRVVEPQERSIPAALALGPALLDAARATGAVHLAASLVAGPAVLLGARQHAGRLLDLAACARGQVAVFRRATSGTAAYLGARAVVFALALPRVAALAADAQPRTLLNRNVRGFLQGFSRAGALAHYFGREWIAVRHRPAAVLAFDHARDGAVLLELVAGFDAPIALPQELATPRERATDRYRERAPIALADVLPPERTPHAFARTVLEGCAARWGQPVEPSALHADEPASGRAVVSPDDPLPPGAVACEPVACPIGWIDAAVCESAGAAARGVWLGGDPLVPGWFLDEIAQSVATGRDLAELSAMDVAVEGTQIAELIAAAQAALARPAPRG